MKIFLPICVVGFLAIVSCDSEMRASNLNDDNYSDQSQFQVGNSLIVRLPSLAVSAEPLMLREDQWEQFNMLACVSVNGTPEVPLWGEFKGNAAWEASITIPKGQSANIKLGFTYITDIDFLDEFFNLLPEPAYTVVAKASPEFIRDVQENITLFSEDAIEFNIDFDNNENGVIDLWELNCSITNTQVNQQCLAAAGDVVSCSNCSRSVLQLPFASDTNYDPCQLL